MTRYQVADVPAAARTVSVNPYGEHVWRWFWQIERARRQGNGLEPLSHQELLAWMQLYGEQLRPWEVDALFHLDAVRRETFAQVAKPDPNSAQNKDPRLSTMVAFDAEGVKAVMGVRQLARQLKDDNGG